MNLLFAPVADPTPSPAGNWFARMLKLKKKGKGETSKVKKSDPYKGIKSFSEVAAVFDFYEVRSVPSRRGRGR